MTYRRMPPWFWKKRKEIPVTLDLQAWQANQKVNQEAMARLSKALVNSKVEAAGHDSPLAFFKRVCEALGCTPVELADALGIKPTDLLKLKRMERLSLIQTPTNDTPMWAALAELINDRLGKLLGLREEMARAFQPQRAEIVRERVASGERP